MFRLSDFAEPGDRITDFATGERYVIPDDTEYTLCAVEGCPLFVEENSAAFDNDGNRITFEDGSQYAGFVHLCNTDYWEDDFYENDHEAMPGETQPLGWWQGYGPLPVRARFGRG